MQLLIMSIKCDEPVAIESADCATNNFKQHTSKDTFLDELQGDPAIDLKSVENKQELQTLPSADVDVVNVEVVDQNLSKGRVTISTESANDNCYSDNPLNGPEKHGSFEDFQTYFDSNFPNNKSADCNDEFSEFASFDTQNFANFETMNNENTSNGNKTVDDDDEFADFETVKADQDDNVSVDQKTKIVQDLLKDTFSLSIHNNYDISHDLFDSSISKQSEELWKKLQTIDMNSNFYYEKWKNSSTFKFLLQSLKIDPRNLIHSDLFFSRPCNQILQPTLYQTIPNAPLSAQPSDLSEKLEFNNTNNGAFQYVLHLNQDLDFFESKYNCNKKDVSNVKDDLISEFEDGSLEKPSKPIPQSSSATDLKEMLKISVVNTMSEQVLSAEALQVLSELPNLSFVRAKVLMFPIQHETSDQN